MKEDIKEIDRIGTYVLCDQQISIGTPKIITDKIFWQYPFYYIYFSVHLNGCQSILYFFRLIKSPSLTDFEKNLFENFLLTDYDATYEFVEEFHFEDFHNKIRELGVKFYDLTNNFPSDSWQFVWQGCREFHPKILDEQMKETP
jgi:hypothetical protein